MCTAIKAYDTSWNLLTPAQLSALKAGDKVRFTVAGSPADQIDKAQFAITAMVGEVNQGTPSGDVTVKKPGTDEYFFEYTIPDGTKSVSVTGQVHHSTLGWY
jgi:plastocyanin